MIKKHYIAIISDDKTGMTKGSVLISGFKWKSAKAFHQHLINRLSDGQHISSFQRVK